MTEICFLVTIKSFQMVRSG